MNWFQRYGIPGAYFIGLMVGWIHAFYPNLLKNEAVPDPEWLLALAAATFIPIGYVISIIEQTMYLNWRRCFARWRELRGWLGVHGAALDRLEPDNRARDEAIIEAQTLLLTASRNGALSVDTHKYIRNWIARRADICAINLSLVVATVLAGIIALVVVWPKLPGDFSLLKLKIILSSISVFVISVMICSYRKLRRQVIEVIAGIYRTYR